MSAQGSSNASKSGSPAAGSIFHRGPNDQEDERLSQAETVVKSESGEHNMDEREPPASSRRSDHDSNIRHDIHESSTPLAHPLDSDAPSHGSSRGVTGEQVNGHDHNNASDDRRGTPGIVLLIQRFAREAEGDRVEGEAQSTDPRVIYREYVIRIIDHCIEGVPEYRVDG